MSRQERSSTLSVENLVIVGSGPAGYTAAIYAARANLKPLLITGFQKGGIPGGQLMTTTHVENFPGFPNGILGPELMDLMKLQASRWGTEYLEDDVVSVDLSGNPFLIETSEDLIKTHSLIIATGAKANRLGLPKEDLFWGKGISACAICDGATPQFRREEIGVVGGGDSACEEAVYLTKFGSHVHLLVRSNKLRASAPMINRVKNNSQITIHWNTEAVDVNGDEWLSSIKLKRLDLNKIETLQIKGLFYAIGHTPNTEIFSTQLNCDKYGYLLTAPGRPETSLDGIFAAGDVADSEWRQGITAAGSGCTAALAAESWLNRNGLASYFDKELIEPKLVQKQTITATSDKDNYDCKTLWQKGSYALRKLYHESKKPLLVIYTSSNCGPCYVLKPQLTRVVNQLGGKVQAIEIDIESEQDIAMQAKINGTPTVQLFKEKVLIKQWKGVKQRKEYIDEIKKVM